MEMHSGKKTRRAKKLKICLAFSPGGHCLEAMQLVPTLAEHTLFYAAPYAVTTKDLKKIYYLKDPSKDGQIKAYFSDIAIALKLIIRERPDVIVTTGAQIVIPLCYLSKFLNGSKIVFVETFARMTTPSVTGRIIYPIADLFLIQWRNLTRFYGKKAQYVGTVF